MIFNIAMTLSAFLILLAFSLIAFKSVNGKRTTVDIINKLFAEKPARVKTLRFASYLVGFLWVLVASPFIDLFLDVNVVMHKVDQKFIICGIDTLSPTEAGVYLLLAFFACIAAIQAGFAWHYSYILEEREMRRRDLIL